MIASVFEEGVYLPGYYYNCALCARPMVSCDGYIRDWADGQWSDAPACSDCLKQYELATSDEDEYL
jgi:hypothetical protein